MLQGGRVRTDGLLLPGLGRQRVQRGPRVQVPLQQGQEVPQRHRLAAPHVEEPVWRRPGGRPVQPPQHGLRLVVHVREVAPHPALAVKVEGPPRAGPAGRAWVPCRVGPGARTP